MWLINENDVETVVLLVRNTPDAYVRIKMDARFVRTTSSHLPCPMYYVQMKRNLAMISPLYETLEEAIAWFEANAPALYPEYFGIDAIK